MGEKLTVAFHIPSSIPVPIHLSGVVPRCRVCCSVTLTSMLMASMAGDRCREAAVSASSITPLLEAAAVDRQVSKQQLS